MAQSVERPTPAQVMISRFVSSSPASGSVLMAQSLELIWILGLPLSLPLPHLCVRVCSLSLSLSQEYINIKNFNKKNKKAYLKMFNVCYS